MLDPLRRMALDAKVRLKEAKAQRFKQYDSKRKAMVEELEERERAFKKAKMEQQKEEVARWHETEKIKEEGKRLREERQRAMQEREREQEAAARQAEQEASDVPSIGEWITAIHCVRMSLLTFARRARHDRPRQVHAHEEPHIDHSGRHRQPAHSVRRHRHRIHCPRAQAAQEGTLKA